MYKIKKKNIILSCLLLLMFTLTAFSAVNIAKAEEEQGYINIQFDTDLFIFDNYNANEDLTVVLRYPTNYPVYDYEIILLSLTDIVHTYNATTKKITFTNGIDISMSNADLEKAEGLNIQSINLILGDYEHTPPGTWNTSNVIYHELSSGGFPNYIYNNNEHYTYTVNYPLEYEDDLYYYADIDVSEETFYLNLSNDDSNPPTLFYNSPINVRLSFTDDTVYWLEGYATINNISEYRWGLFGIWRACEVTITNIEITLSKFHYDLLSEKSLKNISLTLQFGNDVYSLRIMPPEEGDNSYFTSDIDYYSSATELDKKDSNDVDEYGKAPSKIWDWLNKIGNGLQGILGNAFQAFKIIIIAVMAVAIFYIIYSNRKKQ